VRLTAPTAIGELVPGFAPASALERRLSTNPALLQGLAWNVHHPGHPESRVGVHVASILQGVIATGHRRADLRFIALVHDSFKHQVDPAAGYSGDNDHDVLAARFAKRFTRDRRLLDAIKLHDEAYWIWHNGGTGLAALFERSPTHASDATAASSAGRCAHIRRWRARSPRRRISSSSSRQLGPDLSSRKPCREPCPQARKSDPVVSHRT
jgi:hypothetical protein